MKFVLKCIIYLAVFLFYSNYTLSQSSEYIFKENKGQWHNNIMYKAEFNNFNIYIEDNKIKYHFFDLSFLNQHGHKNDENHIVPEYYKNHVYEIEFLNSNNSNIISIDSSSYYYNYILGNDNTKWKSKIRAYRQLKYNNIYDNIDMKYYVNEDYSLKYDFIIKQNADISDIKLKYSGQDKITINKNGELVVKTSISEVVELKPYSYQIINGKKIEIKSRYKLSNNILSFEVEKYNKNYDLIIDPQLIFSTVSGAVVDNWGNSATYDINKNAYGAGTLFGPNGYPTTVGAFQSLVTGVQQNIAISKFSPNGSNLLYATLLGGNKADIASSLVTDENENLYILCSTSSSNFPMTINSYDNTHNGGSLVNSSNHLSIQLINFDEVDIAIAKLSSDGTTLLGSTYYGGNSNDGINSKTTLLHNNYGDEFRGEIVIDNFGNVLIATSTFSTNIANSLNTNSGGLEGVIAKFNSNLSSQLWSRYIGGGSNDNALALQIDNNNNIFVTGGTSGGLPLSQNTYGGSIDGYISKIDQAGNLINSRYVGTSSWDVCYFVQIDEFNNVYTCGQSEGNFPVTPGKYSNPNSHQFIYKTDNALSNNIYSTVFGSGRNNIDMSLHAFLVNNCGNIYVSGWAGSINNSFNAGSSSAGFPITFNAHQTFTDGNDFYLLLLSDDATLLNYASFFGGNNNLEHVDGGTSRFDKEGNVYQAVCACDGGSGNFPTTPGAYQTNVQSFNCNLAVFKMEIEFLKAQSNAAGSTICINSQYQFNNSSTGGNSFYWEFGDGTTSTDFQPLHTYLLSGTYNVTLIVSDTTGCVLSDTAEFQVTVESPIIINIKNDTSICPGESAQLFVTGGINYNWSPGNTLNNVNIANPIATPSTTTTYMVTTTSLCGKDTAFTTVNIFTNPTSISNDIHVCYDDTTVISAAGGVNYLWSPNIGVFSNLNNNSIIVSPNQSITYNCLITTIDGCDFNQDIYIDVETSLPISTLLSNYSKCFGEGITLSSSDADQYTWVPQYQLTNINDSSVLCNTNIDTTYYLYLYNVCGTTIDTTNVDVIILEGKISDNQVICYNENAVLTASGGINYYWTPEEAIIYNFGDSIVVNPSSPTEFVCIISDVNGCNDTVKTFVDFTKIPELNLPPDGYVDFSVPFSITATHSFGNFYWIPHNQISCLKCESIEVIIENKETFYAVLIDTFNCKVIDSITLNPKDVLYVPNSFSPNGDKINDVFKIHSINNGKIHFQIFNRWGELIFETNDPNQSWNGTYKGVMSKVDTYVWKLTYYNYNNDKKEMIGHVNLIR